MRKVIMIGEEPKEESKGVEFTYCLNDIGGWERAGKLPSYFNRVAYLGKCVRDGDMFACYSPVGYIQIYKGNLNNGTY
jgi:hypothetical protein